MATPSAPSKLPSSLAPLDLRIGSSELGAEMGVEGTRSQLLSPPSSPASSMSPLALSLSGLGAGASNSSSGSSTPMNSYNASRPAGFASPASASPLDSSYAALIRQWCFTGSPSGTPSATATPAPTPGPVGAVGFGRGYGAGFPGFAVGGMTDAGMVGERAFAGYDAWSGGLPLSSARAVIDPFSFVLLVFYRARTRKEGVLIHAIVSLQLICAYPPLRPLLPFSTNSYDIALTYLTHFDP
ncbi:uncharacterized protein B0H18DRAFT_1118966 [Fomitopsis serialis]|uniref:uncharacterized protein n=1 Tax=Fomitopsis serialis TaxID=139415 RepID=UPI002007DC93|nr:uncharacterized protein B0H18DRAFT_1118966 [Neoantrodia serialis]KAH9926475.1 hypothetical protein B0H18DRAFT_1118966 [Neoantrodia serialis]